MDSNHRPHAYQACALTRLSYRPSCIRTREGYRPPLRVPAGAGGPDRDRTDDLLDANQALSQLSYGPECCPGGPPARFARDVPRAPAACAGNPHSQPARETTTCDRRTTTPGMDAQARSSKTCPSVFKNRIEILIGSVDLSSLLEATLLRKEVIQPQVLLQLPCYDFTPITKFTIET